MDVEVEVEVGGGIVERNANMKGERIHAKIPMHTPSLGTPRG